MNFDFSSTPRLYFGPGKLDLLPDIVSKFGTHVLVITGKTSFEASSFYPPLLHAFKKDGIRYSIESVVSEPSPDDIDTIVSNYHDKSIQTVAAIGGGSVIDAGKAVSAMLPKNEPVIHYLEGVGSRIHDGKKLPFIAVPTTAGTGSEATRNAVISLVGKSGFKKSLRHDNFMPDAAVIDPRLATSCPAHVTAACGMDALTQLIESLVSTKASPMTDGLVLGALDLLGDSLLRICKIPSDIELRSSIGYAAYISGLSLANAGLGAVHGFASVIGGYFDIPHGVICGRLLAPVTRKSIEIIVRETPEAPSLEKYARVFSLLAPHNSFKTSLEGARLLPELLENWSKVLGIPRLGDYGVKKEDIKKIVAVTGVKNNPCQLNQQALSDILEESL